MALRAGETLRFGDAALDATAISFKRGRCAWADLRLVRLQPGKVAFLRHTTLWPWRTIRLDAVPHPAVFTTLVRELAVRVEVDDWLAGLSDL
jgi:hypothetical protein